jgi:hypothetical protein
VTFAELSGPSTLLGLKVRLQDGLPLGEVELTVKRPAQAKLEERLVPSRKSNSEPETVVVERVSIGENSCGVDRGDSVTCEEVWNHEKPGHWTTMELL